MRNMIVLLLLASRVSGQDFAASADAYVQSWVRDGQFRGAVLVAKDGAPVFRRAYGFANEEWDLASTPETKFRLGSITKQFTAVAILQLAERGKLKLEDPIKAYYADAPAAWDQITIRHLLNHTSGIPSYTDQPGFFAQKSRDRRTPAEIAKLTQDLPLQFEPGAQFRYNNTGYVLLGHVIEKVTGETYPAYVRKNLFDPLGMKDSGYDSSVAILKKRATGYSGNGENAAYLDMSLPHAAGSLYSTVDDLLKWDQAIDAGKLITKESFAQMTTPGKGDYGFGLVIRPIGGHKTQAHGGGINGFSTFMARFPDHHVTVIVLANQEGGAPSQIATALARLQFGEDVPPRPLITEMKLPAEKLDAFAGRYELTPTFVLKVWRDGAQLLTQATGQGVLPVFAMSEHRFFAKVVAAQLEFNRDAEGKVTGVTLHQGGKAMPAKRLPE